MKFTKFTSPLLAALLLVGPMATPCAAASDLPGMSQIQIETESGWEISISPLYFWAAGFDGTIGVFGAQAKLNVTPIDLYVDNLGDVLDALDGFYQGAGEIRYDKFGFFYDIYYVDLLSSKTVSKNILEANVDAAFKLFFATMAGTYRAYEDDTVHIDALAGLRVWDVKLDVGLDINGKISDDFQDGKTWVDPVIGVKGGADISDNVYLKGWAMVGGFGAGSDFMWDVFGGAGYDFNNWLSAFVGFRAGGANYKNDSFKWDITMYGPIIGLGVQF
jgi:hypothetical protein